MVFKPVIDAVAEFCTALQVGCQPFQTKTAQRIAAWPFIVMG